MKKVNISVLTSLIFGVLFLSSEAAADYHQSNTKEGQTFHSINSSQEEDDEYDILERDEIDDTDSLAIPFDDSEVEDEEEIDHLEKKDVFHLPHSR